MTDILEVSTLTLGFAGCLGIIVSFIAQLHTIYKTKDATGTSWGLIILQLFASTCLAISSGINIYKDGIANLPFLVTNISVLFLFIIMSYMKYTYNNLSIQNGS